jgi:hypothetical protein
VLHQPRLALKLFVERKDGSFLLAVEVASTSSAAWYKGIAGGCWKVDACGWAFGIGTCSNGFRANARNISGTATPRGVIIACRNGRVRLSDGVGAGGHFEGYVVWLRCFEYVANVLVVFGKNW